MGVETGVALARVLDDEDRVPIDGAADAAVTVAAAAGSVVFATAAVDAADECMCGNKL